MINYAQESLLLTDQNLSSKVIPVNTAKTSFKSLSWGSAGLLLVSAASLTFQINLTRLFSVSQFYHFAFMAVSIALLGMGASGTVLALRKEKPNRCNSRNYQWLALASGLSMLGAYLLVNQVPFDSFSMFVNPIQILILLLHYAALASPFFFTGMTIGMLLRESSTASGEVYAVNLVGSALGCLAAVIIPSWVGPVGTVTFSAAIASLAGLCFLLERNQTPLGPIQWRDTLPGALSTILAIGSLLMTVQTHSGQVPDSLEVHISPYKSIAYALQNPDAEVISTRWNNISKVQVVRSPSLHSVPGLSYRYLEPLPQVDALFVDGGNMTPILPPEAEVQFAEYLPAAIAFQLRPAAHVLILEPRGGLDIQAALGLGAGQVTAVEGNPLIVAAAPAAYQHPQVTWVPSSGRSYLRTAQGRYDIIQLPLTDSYQPVGSGAYSLGEDYRFTVEAFQDMLAGLQPDGLLVITRWLQEVPSEWLRVFTLAVTALERMGMDPGMQIIALRGYNTGTLLVKNGAFTPAEVDLVRQFAAEKAFDLVFAPNLEPTEVNRFNILPEPVYHRAFTQFLAADPHSDFYRAYPFAVEPPTDDHPFFNHYFKWSQLGEILRTLGITWQPFGGAGYLVILVIFALAVLLSGVMILLPAAWVRQGRTQTAPRRIPTYFAMIGFAFMLVEIPLIQRFILLLDQPTYALAAVLFGILLFSGLGSRFGSHEFKLSHALIALCSLLLIYSLVLPSLLHAALGLSLPWRLLITLLLIAPLGFLMGIPFPSGLAWMHRALAREEVSVRRWMVAWIWAVNGASSVLASILASLLALSFGFNATFALGMGCYALAWLLSRGKSGKKALNGLQ
jgi:hypothetical protein